MHTYCWGLLIVNDTEVLEKLNIISMEVEQWMKGLVFFKLGKRDANYFLNCEDILKCLFGW